MSATCHLIEVRVTLEGSNIGGGSGTADAVCNRTVAEALLQPTAFLDESLTHAA